MARYRLWNPTHEQQRERYGVAGIGGGWMDGRVGGRLGGGRVYSTLPFIHPRALAGAHKPVFGIYKRVETQSRTHSTRMDDYESERVPWSPPTGTRCPPN